MSESLVAIDVSARKARIAVIEASFRRSALSSLQTVEFDEDMTLEERWMLIRGACPEDTATLVVSADPEAISTRTLRFPFSDPKKVEASLDFELESQLPYDLENVVTTWAMTVKDDAGARVLTAITPRDGFIESLQGMRAAGLEARSILMPSVGLAELVAANNVDSVAVVSLGSTISHVAILADGIRYARTLRTGGLAIDRKLAKYYKVSEADARNAKEREAHLLLDTSIVTTEEAELSSQIELGLKPLIRELITTFRSLPPEEVPSRILLTGGMSRLPGLAPYLAQRLEVEVELIDLKADAAPIEFGDKPVPPEFAVALGLALSQLRRGSSVPLNFRRGEFAYSGDFAAYRGEIIRVGIGVAIVALIALIGSIVRFTVIGAEEDQIDAGFCNTSQKIVGQRICDPNRLLAILKQPTNVAGGVVLPTYSAADLLNTVSQLLGTDVDVTLDDLEIRVDGRADEPDKLTAKGEASSFEMIETVTRALQKDPCFVEAEVSRQRKSRDGGRVEFNLDAAIQCPPGTIPGQALAAAR